ncbi:MAG: DMT family transporter [Acetobacterales bacterium]
MPVAEQESAGGLPDNVVGALWMLAAGLLFTVMMAMMKQLTLELPVALIVFLRMFAALLFILPALVWAGGGTWRLARTRFLRLQLARSLLGFLSLALFTFGLSRIILADAVAIQFTTPLWSVLLSVLVLGEVVRVRRWTATVVGFVGVLMIAKPGVGMDPAMFAVVGSALCVSVVMLLLRRLGRTESPLTTIFYVQLVGSVLPLPFAVAVWQWPTVVQWWLVAAIGLTAAIGQYCFTRAFERGEVSIVAPMDYVRLPVAAALGFMLFAELPDVIAVSGMALIVGSAWYIATREARLRSEGDRDRGRA